jgi:hypothetical protein
MDLRIGRLGLFDAQHLEWLQAARHRTSQAARRCLSSVSTKEGRMSERDDEMDEERRAKLVKAGVAVGIGSAAIVAALLYASKLKKPRPK